MVRMIFFLATSVGVSGCTWQQAYTSAQGWQRNTCYRLVDATERERCLGTSGMPYDEYRRRIADGGSSAASPKQ